MIYRIVLQEFSERIFYNQWKDYKIMNTDWGDTCCLV